MIKSDDAGKLILRLALGILVIMHGLAKLSSGVGGIAGMLSSHGLPGFLAYFAYVGEIVGPLLIILGIYCRLGALLVVLNMVVAILLAHMGQLFSISNTGGWALELQGMFLFGALALAFMGAGRFSLAGSGGRWN
ncbi:DoxX family protein [Bordetella parapertussis]|uniref:Membrane protein n=7 Tax=Bordetella TaxID=517 RepID=A0A0U1RNC1_BORP1|nr:MULTISPECIES: DoxX family protein [Bordetella]KAK61339.1 DoxX family protein [Bordetella bronchiseptica 980-2]KCV27765.1 DoxX family protein [Bordetella bronchiseptica 00-P-2730]KDD53297.1 DoxX family protein [Bordetella bronchiseptica OSU553]SHR70918.1 DoxX [Mycobacteroides abscessus subsp. abscessus]AMG89072.1 DoxX family protein [Bordetella bronchiseptica]